MVVSAEIVTCFLVVAAAVKLATSEYKRVRKTRQMNQALRFALDELA